MPVETDHKENAIKWHSRMASPFDQNYQNKAGFKERYRVWTDVLSRYSNPDFKVIDLGCGSGVFTVPLAANNKQVLAVDGSHEMLELSRQKVREKQLNNVEFVQCDVKEIHHKIPDQVDMIISSSVLEYVDDLKAVLGEIKSCLNPGGLVILSMPNKQSLYRRMEPISYKLFGRPSYYGLVRNIVTRKEFERILIEQGYAVLEHQYYGPTKALSSLLRTLGIPQYSDNMFITVVRLQ